MLPFFMTIPHSGEKVPDECGWLKNLPENILMCDVDRYVDRLYQDQLQDKQIPSVMTRWHRYAADLNRLPDDIDRDSVDGNKNPSGKFSRGFHWVMTTKRQPLMTQPMSPEVHQSLVQLIYEPFHQSIRNLYEKFEKHGARDVFHLDAHSMPSVGTGAYVTPASE